MGSRGRAHGQEVTGRSPPEAETLFAFERSMEASNLPTFLKFGNAKKTQIFALSLQEIMGGCETGRGAKAKLGAVPPGLGLKPPLVICLT